MRSLISDWLQQGMSGTAIHAALQCDYGFTGSYSSVYRNDAIDQRAAACGGDNSVDFRAP
jgi:hypothetical protein